MLTSGCNRSVTDPRDGRKVALKKMPNVFQNLVSCKRVFRELRMLCFFKHDNVSFVEIFFCCCCNVCFRISWIDLVMMLICSDRCFLPLTFSNLHKSTALRRCILHFMLCNFIILVNSCLIIEGIKWLVLFPLVLCDCVTHLADSIMFNNCCRCICMHISVVLDVIIVKVAQPCRNSWPEQVLNISKWIAERVTAYRHR